MVSASQLAEKDLLAVSVKQDMVNIAEEPGLFLSLNDLKTVELVLRIRKRPDQRVQIGFSPALRNRNRQLLPRSGRRPAHDVSVLSRREAGKDPGMGPRCLRQGLAQLYEIRSLRKRKEPGNIIGCPLQIFGPVQIDPQLGH